MEFFEKGLEGNGREKAQNAQKKNSVSVASCAFSRLYFFSALLNPPRIPALLSLPNLTS